jgi:phenylacetate-CoA ligase
VTRHDRWAILGGQLVTPIARREPPFWVWNAALNQLYLSSYHLSAASIPAYLAALERHRVRYVWGYTSSLYAMADEALRQGRVAPPMQVVITNAEPVEEYQRDAISRVFGCPVRETYGMAELVAAASECGAGGLHLWPEVGYVEAFAGSYAVPAGTTGDLVCTSLLNADMPLIRYRVGDRGAVPSAGDACGCGRALPSMPRIEGRVDDVIYLADGRRVGRLDPVFKDRLPVREAQIVQESLGRVRIRYVPAPGFTSEAARSMIDRLRARVGAIEVLLEPVVEIPRGASGKFRAVVSELSPDERRRALAS